MRKKLILVSLVFLLLPVMILAQIEGVRDRCVIRKDTGIPDCPGVGSESIFDQTYGNVNGAICCLVSTISYVTDWIFFGLLFIAVIMGLFGAYNIITAGGNTDKVTTGRNYVMYALIGVAVALLSKAIPAIAKTILGV